MSIHSDDAIYRKLQKHLDKMPIGFPETKSGSDIRVLRAFFTLEDAQLALFLTFALFSAEKVYLKAKKTLSLTLEQVKTQLNSMAKRGLIFEFPTPNSQDIVYMIAPLALGFFEYNIDQLTKEKAEAVDQYMKDAYSQEFSATGVQQMRTIPIDASISPEHPVMAYDDVWKLVEQMKPPYVVAPCVCTQEKALLGKTCKHTLTNRCIVNSKWYLDNGHGKEVTKEELIALIKEAQKDGLVLQPGSFQVGAYLCLCCNCCCGILSNAKNFPEPAKMLWSNHFAVVDQSACKECSTCVAKCPMAAISVHSAASINLDRCIGCGVCVANCPEKAIHLEQKATLKEPPMDIVKLYEAMWKKRIQIVPLRQKFAIIKEIMNTRK